MKLLVENLKDHLDKAVPSCAMRNASDDIGTIAKRDYITYLQATAYFWPSEPVSHFSIYTSSDGRNWSRSHPAISSIYSNWLEYIYTLSGLSQVNYVKMVWNNTSGRVWNPELGEVTITY